jgi:TDG/mug DNA glycosylase family protein
VQKQAQARPYQSRQKANWAEAVGFASTVRHPQRRSPNWANGLALIRPIAITVTSVGFTRAELQSFRNESVPDLVGPGLKLLFVGINPGLWTAATQTHFAHPGNRFYPALRLAGIIDRDLDRGRPMTDEDRAYFVERGIGITNLVNRATARADELAPAELRAGRSRLEEFVGLHQPIVVAVAGVTAYRIAFAAPKAKEGEQSDLLLGARVWVVPNPSGLNAHQTISSLAEAYAEPARVAGVIT